MQISAGMKIVPYSGVLLIRILRKFSGFYVLQLHTFLQLLGLGLEVWSIALLSAQCKRRPGDFGSCILYPADVKA